MATINTFSRANQTTTDQVITDLNTNFGNLNTDKIEADSTDTLTNKTINADNNTVSNINSTNCDATGIDNDIVSGTAGTTDNIAKWNSDGDLVDASVAVSTTAPSGSSNNAQIPTSLAVHTAVSNAISSGQRPYDFLFPYGHFATNTDTFEAQDVVTGATAQYVPFLESSTGAGSNYWFLTHIPSGVTAITATLQTTATSVASSNMTDGSVAVFDVESDGAVSSALDSTTVANNYTVAYNLVKLTVSNAFTIANIGTDKAVAIRFEQGTAQNITALWLKLEYTY